MIRDRDDTFDHAFGASKPRAAGGKIDYRSESFQQGQATVLKALKGREDKKPNVSSLTSFIFALS
jgi:hypothetical protein